MILSSAILLGFADSKKMAAAYVGPPEKPNPPADSTNL
jgi:hypothetical protein